MKTTKTKRHCSRSRGSNERGARMARERERRRENARGIASVVQPDDLSTMVHG